MTAYAAVSKNRVVVTCNVSPRREAMRLFTDDGLSSEFTSHGLDGRLGWLVSETQHYPIYVHLQAAACRGGWLHTEGGLSAAKSFPDNK